MADVRDLSWEIIIPPGIDWLVISPSRGTGYARLNVSIIDGTNTDTAATVTLYCTSCDGVVEKRELQILRCETCNCEDFEINELDLCDCGDFTIENLDLCDCEDLTLTPKCGCKDIHVNINSLHFEAGGGTKSVIITKDCEIEYIATPNPDSFIHISQTSDGIGISVDPNPNTFTREGEVNITYKGYTCQKITISQDGKEPECICENLTLTCKTNCN